MQALRNGEVILVTDDEDRENEGDLICAAEFATTENVNFMASQAKGLICMPMSKAFTQKLGLPQMVEQNTDNHATAFTVSIDHVDTTTGISAYERSVTALKCVGDDAKPEDFRRPGTYVSVRGKAGEAFWCAPVIRRQQWILCRLAGLKECGLCCEIMADDGHMMRTPELQEFAQKHQIKFITIADLVAYRRKNRMFRRKRSQCKITYQIR